MINRLALPPSLDSFDFKVILSLNKVLVHCQLARSASTSKRRENLGFIDRSASAVGDRSKTHIAQTVLGLAACQALTWFGCTLVLGRDLLDRLHHRRRAGPANSPGP